MGKRGPKKEDPILQELKGNPSKRPVETVVRSGQTYRVPEYLSERAKVEIEYVLDAMPPDFYGAEDHPILLAYGITMDQLIMANEKIRQNGITVRGSKGQTIPNPFFTVSNSCVKTLMQCADRLNLGPGERARIQQPDDEDLEFQKLLGGQSFQGKSASFSKN